MNKSALLWPDSNKSNINNFYESSNKENDSSGDSFFQIIQNLVNIPSNMHWTLVKLVLKVNMPFINLCTKILELKLVLLSKDKNDVKEHLAVFILLYPKPDLKSLV
jgi:hypothetical protein